MLDILLFDLLEAEEDSTDSRSADCHTLFVFMGSGFLAHSGVTACLDFT